MKLLFIVDPLPGLKIHKDSSYAMMREASARGHEIWTAQAETLCVRAGRIEIHAAPLSFSDTQYGHDWYTEGDYAAMALTDFCATVMRKDPPFDQQYLYATHLLSLAEAHGAKVFNSGQALRDFNEKLSVLRYPQFTAPTLVSQQEDDLRAFLAEHGDIILKPLDGMGGAGIFRVRNDDPNIGSIIETLTCNETRTVMAQRFIPEIAAGDKRVLIIDGLPVDWCLARIPKTGETRGNLAVGGTGVAQALTSRDREIAEALGPQLLAQGLLLVGLDIIGDYLTEVNVTSPTCFQEISTQSGINVAGLFIDAVERRAA
ncbi:glutathione synthase [Formivibrio citricus]|uniref:Glutathione synthetase n=1 Tax=Formivibrio citricus TaxID=83765 RepID=A0A1I4VK09_9NEIS|nr:glutathione synthase [Formivibrio citricus]SFN01460.1 glutathione synthase [Formivibrio citricus]